jgi:thioredoxin-like negative regulator of GroEL
VIALRPEFRAPASRRDALALSEALEKLIDAGRATPADREAVHKAVKEWKEETPEYAYARASIAGRLAEVRGVTAVNLIREMETWGRLAMKLDPKWRDGAARRMVGTLYVLAPASMLQHGNSEDGLQLLEKQTEEYPRDPVNHLRLAEGYVSLNDHEPALEHLCFAQSHERDLRPSDHKLLVQLIDQIGGKSKLSCE